MGKKNHPLVCVPSNIYLKMFYWEICLSLFIVNLSLFKTLHCYHWLLALGYSNIRLNCMLNIYQRTMTEKKTEIELLLFSFTVVVLSLFVNTLRLCVIPFEIRFWTETNNNNKTVDKKEKKRTEKIRKSNWKHTKQMTKLKRYKEFYWMNSHWYLCKI